MRETLTPIPLADIEAARARLRGIGAFGASGLALGGRVEIECIATIE